jgi:hypothetical protein
MTEYDPQLLATFLAVERTGSFTRAAAEQPGEYADGCSRWL